MANGITFDTHKFVKGLVAKQMPQEQAEFLAESYNDLLSDRVATKQDLVTHESAMDHNFESLRKDLKAYEASTEQRFKALDASTEQRFKALEASTEQRFKSFEVSLKALDQKFEALRSEAKASEARLWAKMIGLQLTTIVILIAYLTYLNN